MDPGPVISVQKQLLLVGYTSIPAYVLLYYDYWLTLGDEVQCFWSKKSLGLVAVVFYLNRYVSLLGYIPVISGRYFLSLSSDKTKVCHSLLKYHQYLIGVIQIIAGIAMGCRIYALYERRRWTLIPLTTMALAVAGVGIWFLYHDASMDTGMPQQMTPTGCLTPLPDRDATRYAILWSGALAFDVMIFTMTAYKSLTRKWEQDGILLRILLRDGTIYFGVMVLLTLSVILTFNLSLEYNKGLTASLTNVLSSIMISRLILHLRDPNLNTRPFQARTLTALIATACSNDDFSECISNAEVLLQQFDGTASQVMLLHPRGRTPSDVTDATLVQSLHEGEQDALVQKPNVYQRKILESF